jgi:hypothetical protein
MAEDGISEDQESRGNTGCGPHESPHFQMIP